MKDKKIQAGIITTCCPWLATVHFALLLLIKKRDDVYTMNSNERLSYIPSYCWKRWVHRARILPSRWYARSHTHDYERIGRLIERHAPLLRCPTAIIYKGKRLLIQDVLTFLSPGSHFTISRADHGIHISKTDASRIRRSHKGTKLIKDIIGNIDILPNLRAVAAL